MILSLAPAGSLSVDGFDRRFLEGSTWNQSGQKVKHIETHAAHIFLCGDQAFKIKKPVSYSYLDFSSLDKRRAVLNRELDLNRIAAPTIYQRVTEVLGEPVLVMRRFKVIDLLSNLVRESEL